MFVTQEVVKEISSKKLDGPCFVHSKCHITLPSPLSPQKDRQIQCDAKQGVGLN